MNLSHCINNLHTDSDKDIGARAKDQLLTRVTATLKNGGKGASKDGSKEVSVSRVKDKDLKVCTTETVLKISKLF